VRIFKIDIRQTGFSLIELLVAIMIIGILLSLSVPTIRHTLNVNRVASEINGLAAALNIARSEAIKRGRSVTISDSGSGWSAGWMVFEDTNTNGAFDAGEQVVKISNGINSTDTIFFSGTGTSIRFQNNGFTDNNGSFLLCPSDKDKAYARAIYISSTGRIRLSSDSDNSNVHDDGDLTSTDLSCP
jgi:type IV fimbrial biogenesis protein FimT